MRIRAGFTGSSGYGDQLLVGVQNNDTAQIAAGAPVILQIGTPGTTGNGYYVQSPSTTGAAAANALFYGIAQTAIPVNGRDDVVAYGISPTTILRVGTRAATTDSWTSSASIASWCALGLDTINNCFSTIAGSVGTAFLSNAVILCQSVASYTASASATSDTRTAITTSVQAFVRIM